MILPWLAFALSPPGTEYAHKDKRGMQFHNIGYARDFFNQQLPDLTKAINRQAPALEEANRLERQRQGIPKSGDKLTLDQALVYALCNVAGDDNTDKHMVLQEIEQDTKDVFIKYSGLGLEHLPGEGSGTPCYLLK